VGRGYLYCRTTLAAHVEFGASMVTKLRQRDPPSCQLATASSALDASCPYAHRPSLPDSSTPAAHHGSEAKIEMFSWRPALDWRWEPERVLRRRTRVCLRYDGGGVPPSSQGQCRLVPCFYRCSSFSRTCVEKPSSAMGEDAPLRVLYA
jgi:hypothetical protein